MSIFVVQAASASDADMLKARFINDGFSWPAFVFGALWLLYYRLWLAFAVYAVLDVAFLFLLAPRLSSAATFAVSLLARLFITLEGDRWRLAKNARSMTLNEIIEARDRDEAEAIFYARHSTGETLA